MKIKSPEVVDHPAHLHKPSPEQIQLVANDGAAESDETGRPLSRRAPHAGRQISACEQRIFASVSVIEFVHSCTRTHASVVAAIDPSRGRGRRLSLDEGGLAVPVASLELIEASTLAW